MKRLTVVVAAWQAPLDMNLTIMRFQKKMAERVLIPAILSKPDALVIANGFSCRHQIADFASRKAVHIAEAFEVVDKKK